MGYVVKRDVCGVLYVYGGDFVPSNGTFSYRCSHIFAHVYNVLKERFIVKASLTTDIHILNVSRVMIMIWCIVNKILAIKENAI